MQARKKANVKAFYMGVFPQLQEDNPSYMTPRLLIYR